MGLIKQKAHRVIITVSQHWTPKANIATPYVYISAILYSNTGAAYNVCGPPLVGCAC